MKVVTLKPFFDVEGYFIDIPDQPTFDPKHPTIYPGDEVKPLEVLNGEQAIAKYGNRLFNGEVLYTSTNSGARHKKDMTVTIWYRTGRTSADVLLEAR